MRYYYILFPYCKANGIWKDFIQLIKNVLCILISAKQICSSVLIISPNLVGVLAITLQFKICQLRQITQLTSQLKNINVVVQFYPGIIQYFPLFHIHYNHKLCPTLNLSPILGHTFHILPYNRKENSCIIPRIKLQQYICLM